jgi:tetratricopeptide (TPR) repeat protein
MSEPLLTLCVIARNEEATIERCLESARPLVDDIVVVDTGSADATRSIAKRMGARVYSHPWENDFSTARNCSLEQARTPWILVMDCDEEIAEVTAEALRNSLATTDAEAFSVRIDNMTDGGGVASFRAVRLFRNRPEIRYRGRIHEEVTSALAELAGGPVSPSPAPLVLNHEGYVKGGTPSAEKRERNLQILRRALKTDPRQAMLNFALAREMLIVSGERIFPGVGFPEALEALNRALQAAEEESVPAHLAVRITATLASAMISDFQPGVAEELLDGLERRADVRALAADDAGRLLIDFTRARAILAGAGEDRDRLERAASLFAALIDRPMRPGFTDVDARICGVFAMERQAEALGRLGRLDEALVIMERATTSNPCYGGPLVRRAELELLHGRPQEALKSYSLALKADGYDPEAWLGIGRLLNALGETDQALDSISNALRLVPVWGQALLEQATARLLRDLPQEVLAEQSAYREMSPEADTTCLVAEILSDQPVTGLQDWSPQSIDRSLVSIAMSLTTGGRQDLLERLKDFHAEASATEERRAR